MDLILLSVTLTIVIWMYFRNNPLKHSKMFLFRRFANWFPLGMTYSFLYMGRYNLNVSKNALGSLMTKEDFGIIFAAGTVTYAVSFLFNGPLVDRIGGKKGILIAALGTALANISLGIVTYLYLHGYTDIPLIWVFAIIYSINMYFQSYGAVSIIKVKAYWFHVRERGIFGAIFGTLISFGVYFAFDWGQAIVNATKASIPAGKMTFMQEFLHIFIPSNSAMDATWMVFFVPAGILLFWIIIDIFLIKDTPKEAGYADFDTHDASSGEMDKEFSSWELLKKILTNPIMITIAIIELSSGVLRNGLMQWYLIFAKDVPQPGAEFFSENWGLLLCMSGIAGGFAAGIISDKVFHSRRGPVAALFTGSMIVFTTVMAIFLFRSPIIVGAAAIFISFSVIGVHSILSGTAAADFGGRKASATASGITDGFVYLGSGIQSLSLGYITTWNWQFWPIFLIPFAILGMVFSIKIWRALPAATKKYIETVESVKK